ncbi:MAG: xanthine dehydrogenase [Bacillota bacterium]|nr:MAG: xanthine dehydrogenase [Bacillota bacterium]
MSVYHAVGVSRPRPDGPDKVAGRTRYVADMTLPGMLYAALVLSPHPRARIRAVDTAAARSLPGVAAVLTGGDLPPLDLMARDEVYYVGHPVAAVLAGSEAAAAEAAEQVRVEYEVLPAVLDPLEAMSPGAPLARPDLHGGRGDAGAHGSDAGAHGSDAGGHGVDAGPGAAGAAGGDKPRNVDRVIRHRRGDPEAAWSQCDLILEDTYRLARVHQGYMEPLGCIAEPRPGGGVTIWTPTQGQFFVQRETARELGLEEHQVRVVPLPVGGGFGGKIMLLEPLAAALALAVRRPVRLVLSRTADFYVSNPGAAVVIRLKMGARRDGTLLALEGEIIQDSGAAPGSPPGAAALLLGSTYRIPNVAVTAYDVLTNKTPVGAYRAPGAPQAYFALESHLDRIARALDLDPVELRLRHAVVEGDPRSDGRTWPSIGLVQCLERLRQHPTWQGRGALRGPDEGWGLAVGGWPGGTEAAAAACRVNGDGTVTVTVGAVDLTGSHSAMAAIAAEVLGLPPERVRVVTADTEQAPLAGMSAGSKTVYTVGAAVQAAAEDVRAQILAMAADVLEAAVHDLELRDGRVQIRGVPSRAVEIAELARMTARFGSRYAPLHGFGRSAVHVQAPGFAVHLARVRVDRDTGRIQVLQYLAVQDVGRAINPAEVLGQIHGGIAQGIGRALTERLVHDPAGQLATATLSDYLMPTAGEMPPIEAVLVEVPAPHGPFGAKGVGEPPVVPCAAAIANAVEDAVGVRLTEVPMTPDLVLQALRAQGGRGE